MGWPPLLFCSLGTGRVQGVPSGEFQGFRSSWKPWLNPDLLTPGLPAALSAPPSCSLPFPAQRPPRITPSLSLSLSAWAASQRPSNSLFFQLSTQTDHPKLCVYQQHHPQLLWCATLQRWRWQACWRLGCSSPRPPRTAPVWSPMCVRHSLPFLCPCCFLIDSP